MHEWVASSKAAPAGSKLALPSTAVAPAAGSSSLAALSPSVPPSVSLILPESGPCTGTFKVAVFGLNFQPSSQLALKLGDGASLQPLLLLLYSRVTLPLLG